MLDIRGETYGRLVVVDEWSRSGKERRWLCLCSCDKVTVVLQANLRSGKTQSCGCLNAELAAGRVRTRHGRTTPRTASEKYAADVVHQRRHRYGIEPADFAALLRAQFRQCAICRIPLALLGPGEVCVDHDHETGKVRGVLCRGCNVGIGSLGESVRALEAAIRYLKRA